MDKKETTLVKTVQQQILDYITKGGYSPNQVLPKENELSDILGVSRVVLREALSSLRALGFIETKRKKGTVLISPQPFSIMGLIINSGALNNDSIRDLYELRLMLEVGSADFIFERKNEEHMDNLLQLIEEEENTDDLERLIEIDMEFHSSLYRMANSRSLSDFQSLIAKIFSFYPQTRNRPEIVTHRGLYTILKNGNPDLFRSAMRLHLTYQFDNRDEYLDAYFKKQIIDNQ
ncbi:GntR family transcriptional regulator [Bacteroidales bacterium OttesenSCG-928-M11]|nr:GntR family transcriptional regulator [Bacteroidales bacterium OttesenSCG-928-M11]